MSERAAEIEALLIEYTRYLFDKQDITKGHFDKHAREFLAQRNPLGVT